MAAPSPDNSKRFPKKPAGASPGGARRTALDIKRAGSEGWELVHPRCAEQRREDLDEVRQMIDAGELDLARDELRWLLEDCRDLLEAHRLLGEIALEEQDWKLGRAHFGYAFKLGTDCLASQPDDRRFPYSLAGNQAFLEAGKGLAHCLQRLGNMPLARDVLHQMLRCEPADPLGAAAMLAGMEQAPPADAS